MNNWDNENFGDARISNAHLAVQKSPKRRLTKSEHDWNEDNNPMLNGGIHYEDCIDDRSTAPHQSLQDVKYGEQIRKAQEARKSQGLKPLTGTAAQKKWAEQIRQKAIGHLTAEALAELMPVLSKKHFLASKFWIENRSIEADIIKKFMQ